MAKFKIKKGDKVVVITGSDRGKTGEVLRVLRSEMRVLVQGVNMVHKNKKVDYQGRGAGGSKQGGIINTEALIHVSNVQLIDPDTKKPARAGYRYDENGAKIRVSRPGGKDF